MFLTIKLFLLTFTHNSTLLSVLFPSLGEQNFQLENQQHQNKIFLRYQTIRHENTQIRPMMTSHRMAMKIIHRGVFLIINN